MSDHGMTPERREDLRRLYAGDGATYALHIYELLDALDKTEAERDTWKQKAEDVRKTALTALEDAAAQRFAKGQAEFQRDAGLAREKALREALSKIQPHLGKLNTYNDFISVRSVCHRARKEVRDLEVTVESALAATPEPAAEENPKP